MHFKRILFISIIILIMSIGAISAADLNETSSQTVHMDHENPVSQHSYVITTDTNKNYASDSFHALQNKIEHAAWGSVVSLSSDYHGEKGAVVKINKDLTIDGNGHTIDCLYKDGCFAFSSSSGNIVLKNLKITHGENNDNCRGGAIHIAGTAKYTLENCTFDNNFANAVTTKCYGGAISNEGNNPLTIKNCVFTGNGADNYGGAIYSEGDLYIKDSTFNCNKACSDDGGVIYACKKVFLENTNFKGNKAKVDGGAIYARGDVNVCGCHFEDNSATGAIKNQCYGGAICTNGDVNVYGSKFIENVAADYGGAIYAKNVKINDIPDKAVTCIFEYNHANDNDGGAIYAEGDVSVNDAEFSHNVASDGGAIYACGNVGVCNCKFYKNIANPHNILFFPEDVHGGAILSRYDVSVDNCTFEENSAADWGGAIYGHNIKINTKNHSLKSYFIGNKARVSDGGAIFALENIDIFNAEFSQNAASIDGGAMRAKGNIKVTDSIFNSNSASTIETFISDSDSSLRNHGGAIKANNEIYINNCTFVKNYSGNFGGAVYANTVRFADTKSYFNGNSAEHDGGAIYTNKFGDKAVKNIICENNTAKRGDGGAIYINKETKVSFDKCIFINNHCKDEGGAIYLDSRKSHISLTNNVFNENRAGKCGQSVFTCGYYDDIKYNFWVGKNPTSKNDQLCEWKVVKSNNRHLDKNPAKLDLKISKDFKDGKCIIKVEAILCPTNNVNGGSGEINYLELPSIIFNPDLKVINQEKHPNKLVEEFVPHKSGQFSVTADFYGVSLTKYVYIE